MTKPYSVFALMVCLCALLASCDGKSDFEAASTKTGNNRASVSAEETAFTKYAETVRLTVGFKIPDSKMTTGDTYDNNPVSRYLQNVTGIQVVHAWEAKGDDAFEQKVDLAISSNDIPDAMVVTRAQLIRLLDNDMIQDLSAIYEKYGSSQVKSMYDSTGGRALSDATINGKLYGLPNIAIEADSPSLLWVRQDWLDKLGLQPPRTVAELEKVAEAFVQRDPDGDGKRDTVGLAGYKGIIYGQKPGPNGFDTLFNAVHAFPKNWVRDAEGHIVYGSIDPANKDVLARLADWYKRGLIDPQFALYKEGQEPIVSGRTGLFFGPWWMPYWPLVETVGNDTKAEWRAYAVPLGTDGKFVTHMAPTTDRYLVVRKGYAHPEAAIRLLNAFTRLERRQDPNLVQVKELDEFSARTGIQLRAYYPFDLLLDYADSIGKRFLAVSKVMESGQGVDALDADARKVYDQWTAEKKSPRKDMEGWKTAQAYAYAVSVLEATPLEKVYSIFEGTTKSMEKNWAALEKLENETYFNIIAGDQPVSDFDAFVAAWKRQGGDRITEEVRVAVDGISPSGTPVPSDSADVGEPAKLK